MPLAIPGLRMLMKLRGERKTFINSYVKSRMLTHDFQQAQSYDDDGLIARDENNGRAERSRHNRKRSDP